LGKLSKIKVRKVGKIIGIVVKKLLRVKGGRGPKIANLPA